MWSDRAARAEAPSHSPSEDFRFDILNSQNEKVASASTLSGDIPDLEPGTYRVILHDGAKDVALLGLQLGASETAEIKYDPDRAALERANAD